MTRTRLTRVLALASAALLTLTVTACSPETKDAVKDAADSAKEAHTVNVTLTNDGSADTCSVDSAEAAGGPVKITVTNESASGITEVELLQDQKILGEKENLAPGLDPVSFTVNLDGGDYQIYCPGAAEELTDLTVTGNAVKPTGDVRELLDQGVEDYKGYVTTQFSELVTSVDTLDQAVQDGDVEAAKEAYAQARPHYEKVESYVDGFVMEGFDATDNHGNLDYLIDMRESNLDPEVGWHGFHAIERDVFEGGEITDETKELSTELVENVGKIQEKGESLELAPEDLANGAAGLLEEVQSQKITGEEEAYSHLDLVDFAANVEGAQEAFASFKPALEEIAPDVTKQVSEEFYTVREKLGEYKDPDALGGYKTWDEETRTAHANELSEAVQSLQDPLSTLAEKVVSA